MAPPTTAARTSSEVRRMSSSHGGEASERAKLVRCSISARAKNKHDREAQYDDQGGPLISQKRANHGQRHFSHRRSHGGDRRQRRGGASSRRLQRPVEPEPSHRANQPL